MLSLLRELILSEGPELLQQVLLLLGLGRRSESLLRGVHLQHCATIAHLTIHLVGLRPFSWLLKHNVVDSGLSRLDNLNWLPLAHGHLTLMLGALHIALRWYFGERSATLR